MMYHFAWLMLLPTRLFRKCEGREHIPKRGPCIVLANHVGDLDPYRIGRFFPFRRTIHWFAKKELYRGEEIFNDYFPRIGNRILTRIFCSFLSFTVRHSRTIPVNREMSGSRTNRTAIVAARKLLEDNRIVGIFGEGGIDRKGVVHSVFVGLSRKTGAPVLPVQVSMKKVKIGRPLSLDEGPDDNLTVARRIMDGIYGM